jgi:hypothetical protein
MKKTVITMFALALALGAQAQPNYIQSIKKVSLNLTGFYQNESTNSTTAYNDYVNKTVTKQSITSFKINNADIFTAYGTSAKEGAYLKVATILDVAPEADAEADAQGIFLYTVGQNPILLFTISNTSGVDKGTTTEIGTAPVDDTELADTVLYSFSSTQSGYKQGTLTIDSAAAEVLGLSSSTTVNGAGTFSDSQTYTVKKGKVTANSLTGTTKLATTGSGAIIDSEVENSFVITGGSVVATKSLVK